MTRTFIAIETSAVLQRHLATIIRQVAQALPFVRWVDPTGIHLTLAFLGELSDDQVARALEAATMTAGHAKPFSYRLARLGVFGSPRQPRVIWLGIDEPSGALLRLQRVLNEGLAQRGFTVDARPFSPHLTLARVKSPLSIDEQQRLGALLSGKQQGIASSLPYQVQHLDVMKSELSRSGAQYTRLHTCTLGNGDV